MQRFGHGCFRNLIPGPPPFSMMNSTPAASKARWIFVDWPTVSVPPSSSALFNVANWIAAFLASASRFQPSSSRASRICRPVTTSNRPRYLLHDHTLNLPRRTVVIGIALKFGVAVIRIYDE